MIPMYMFVVLSAATISLAAPANAKNPPKAKVEVTRVQDKLIFKTIPNPGLVINNEGPWQLELKKITGVKPTATTFKRSDWKEETGGFDVPVTVEGKAKEAEIQYKLIAFVCTKEKTQCYREVIDDKATIKL